MSISTGIDDVEWLNSTVVEMSQENFALRSSLRVMLALMESDVEFGYIKAFETRQRVMAEARLLVPKVETE